MKVEPNSYKQIVKATSLFGGVKVFNIIIAIIRSKFITHYYINNTELYHNTFPSVGWAGVGNFSPPTPHPSQLAFYFFCTLPPRTLILKDTTAPKLAICFLFYQKLIRYNRIRI